MGDAFFLFKQRKEQTMSNVIQFPSEEERRNTKPLNGPSCWEEDIGYCTGLCIPGGHRGIPLDEEEVAAYDADRDLWAADYFGLTPEQYREWIFTDGTPLCGATTKAGKPCPVPLGSIQQNVRPWLALHRNGLCSAHRKMAGRAK
jgi:hypothetical protein